MYMNEHDLRILRILTKIIPEKREPRGVDKGEDVERFLVLCALVLQNDILNYFREN